MRIPVGRLLVVAILSVAFSACGPAGPYHKPLVGPIKGQVLVDGNPTAGVRILAHEEGGGNAEHPTLPSGLTDADGNFTLGTYDQGDGVPAGNYKLTFSWSGGGLMSGKPDKFGGRYANPATSKVDLKVADGPVDLGKIELTTK